MCVRVRAGKNGRVGMYLCAHVCMCVLHVCSYVFMCVHVCSCVFMCVQMCTSNWGNMQRAMCVVGMCHTCLSKVINNKYMSTRKILCSLFNLYNTSVSLSTNTNTITNTYRYRQLYIELKHRQTCEHLIIT